MDDLEYWKLREREEEEEEEEDETIFKHCTRRSGRSILFSFFNTHATQFQS